MARYKFLNINPLGKKEQDCVCRAISLALNENYYTIKRKLELVGELAVALQQKLKELDNK